MGNVITVKVQYHGLDNGRDAIEKIIRSRDKNATVYTEAPNIKIRTAITTGEAIELLGELFWESLKIISTSSEQGLPDEVYRQ